MAKRPKKKLRGELRDHEYRSRLKFDTHNKIITIDNSGEITFWGLGAAIEEWKRSPVGIRHPDILDPSLVIALPDGTRLKCLILKDGWRLAATDSVWIVEGYVAGRDQDGKSYYPVIESDFGKIDFLYGGPYLDNLDDVSDAEGADGDQEGGDTVSPVRDSVATVVVETAEDIDTALKQRFSKAPEAVVAAAERARDIASSLQVFLAEIRLNNPEVQEANELLKRQIGALDNIITTLQSGGDSETAQNSYRDQLIDVLESFLERLKEENVTRGLVAAFALAVLGIAGIQVSAIAGALVTGHMLGIDIESLKTILAGLKGKKK